MSKIIVTLRGGTRLQMEAGRGPDKPYDKLIALLDECKSWDGDLAGEWADGTLRAAQVVDEESAPTVRISEPPEGGNDVR